MIAKIVGKKNWMLFKFLTIAGLGLGLCAGAVPAFAQQNQPGEAQATVASPDSQAQGQPDSSAQYNRKPSRKDNQTRSPQASRAKRCSRRR